MSFQSRGPVGPAAELFVSTRTSLSWSRRLALTLAVWKQRIRARRALADMDARSLRDAGISPAAAAYEAGKAFWEKMGDLR